LSTFRKGQRIRRGRAGTLAALHLGLAGLLCWVPLFNVLAYEFCLTVGLLAALTAPVSGLYGLRQARARVPDGAVSASMVAWVLGQALLPLAGSLGLIAANALRVRNCNFGVGLGFFMLLPVCSALYGASLGMLAALVPQRRPAAWGLGAAMLAPLLWRLTAFYTQPPIFAYDHLWGYVAGSLYDESVPIDLRLVGWRLGTLLRCLCCWGLLLSWGRLGSGKHAQPSGGASFQGDRLEMHLAANRPPTRLFGMPPAPWLAAIPPARRWAGLAALLLGLCLAEDQVVGQALHYRVSYADLDRALPVQLTRGPLVVHLPAQTPLPQQQGLADDAAFRLRQLQARLQVADAEVPRPLHAYIYASAADKAVWMGGRDTMFAKPWQHRVHLHGLQSPHPLLAHELAHAVLAPYGSWPLRISARGGVLINMGLVEGLAEALSPIVDETSLPPHLLAATMLEAGSLPPLQNILAPQGFWTQAPQRAYGTTGSFLQYLRTTYGPAPLKAAYAQGDLAAALQRPLPKLLADWQIFLRELPRNPADRQAAAERLRTPSIFARPCAHEIASLQQQAAGARPAQRRVLQAQIAAHLQHAPLADYQLAQALFAGATEPAAEGVNWREALAKLPSTLWESDALTASQRAKLWQDRADLGWMDGQTESAQQALERATGLTLLPAARRRLWVRQWALRQPPQLASLLCRALVRRGSVVGLAVGLQAALGAQPDEPTLHYLLGRQLFFAEDDAAAVVHLRQAGPHPEPSIDSERLRLLGEALLRQGELPAAQAAYRSRQHSAPTAGIAAQAADRLDYIDDFLTQHKTWDKP
jgi:hypothetical protein